MNILRCFNDLKWSLKIYSIMSEPHNDKFFLWTLSKVQLFDFLTSDKKLEIHFNIYLIFSMSSINVSDSAN